VTKPKKLKKVKVPAVQADISVGRSKSIDRLHPAFCFRYNWVLRYKVKDLKDEGKIALVNTLYKLGHVD